MTATPALLTSPCSAWPEACISSTAAATSAALFTSRRTPVTFGTALNASMSCGLRAPANTWNPAAASFSVTFRPIPALSPVTRTARMTARSEVPYSAAPAAAATQKPSASTSSVLIAVSLFTVMSGPWPYRQHRRPFGTAAASPYQTIDPARSHRACRARPTARDINDYRETNSHPAMPASGRLHASANAHPRPAGQPNPRSGHRTGNIDSGQSHLVRTHRMQRPCSADPTIGNH